MGSGEIDFERLGRSLLTRANELVAEWLPGGRLLGKEFTCGNLQGNQGQSLKINISSGLWQDFSTGEKGGDLISLYAAIHNLTQVEAAKKLSNGAGSGNGHAGVRYSTKIGAYAPPPAPTYNLASPPEDAPPPPIEGVTAYYQYMDLAGDVLYYVCRIDKDGDKSFFPLSWDLTSKAWVKKSWPAPRPLFGLEQLGNRPDAPVLLVEGEKCALAARKIVGGAYVVLTWPNGGNSWNKTDWSPIYGRSVLIWPDMDEAGVKAAQAIANTLHPKCSPLKVLDVQAVTTAEDVGVLPAGAFGSGWDAADALDGGWKAKDFTKWGKKIVKVYEPPVVAPVANATSQVADIIAQEAQEPVPVAPDLDLKGLAPGTVYAEPPIDASFHVEHEPQPTSVYSLWGALGLAMSKDKPISNAHNALRVLESWEKLKNLVWFDEFHQKFLTTWRSTVPREWADVDDIELMIEFQRNLWMHSIKAFTIREAIQTYANRNHRNEPKDWMETLQWDGESRIESFFSRGLGAEPNSIYNLAASRNFWLSLVARAYQPGCKVDNMVILEGGQGKFKSTALNRIAGDWYAECHESVTSKDFYLVLQGKLLVEISELEAFGKAETNAIKRVITCRSDRFRPPYGRLAQDFPRRSVFVGTTNDTSYLKDHTGARRFWPVKIGNIDLEYVTTNRDQLFAEAVHRYKASEGWWDMPEAQAKEEQEKRFQTDDWEEVIRTYVESLIEPNTTSLRVAINCLGLEVADADPRVKNRICKVLHRIGWEPGSFREGSKVTWGWTKPLPKPKNKMN